MKNNSFFSERKGKNCKAPLPGDSQMDFRNVFCTFSKMWGKNENKP